MFTRTKGQSPKWCVLTDGSAFRAINSITAEAMFLCDPPSPELIRLLADPVPRDPSVPQGVIDELSYRLGLIYGTRPADQQDEIVEWLEFADCRNWGEQAKATVTSLEVCEQLINAGWRMEDLFRQEPSAEVAIRSEIVVRDHGTFPIMAVCLVSTAVLAEESNSTLFERHGGPFPDVPQVIWLAITDGITYRLKNLLTNELICLNRAPSREFLFATQGSILNQQAVFRPRTTAQLIHYIDELEPTSVTLDFTIDPDRSVAINDYITLDELEYDQGLDALVSSAAKWAPSHGDDRQYYDNPDDEPSATLQQILVCWFARKSCIELISFAATRQYANSLQYKDFRQDVVEYTSLAAVVEIPPPPQNVPSVSNNAQTLVVYMARSFDKTLFHRFNSGQLSTSHCSEIVHRWLDDKKVSEGGSASSASVESWEPRAYADFLLQIKDRLNRIGPLIPLSKLAHIYEGSQPRGISEIRSKSSEVQRTIELKIVDAESLRTGISKKIFVTGSLDSYPLLEPGDILIPRCLSRSVDCLFYNEVVPSIAGNDVLVVSAIDNDYASYIFSFLTSTAGTELLMSKGQPAGDVVNLTVRDLSDLLIPECSSKEVLNSMNELASIDARLQAKVHIFSTQKREIFDEPNGKRFSQRIAELRRHGRVLSSGLDRAAEFEYCVSNFYPYPISFPFRALQSQTVPAEQYQAQLRLAENILAFLASVSLSIASDKADLNKTGVDLKDIWIGGASPGHWKEIIRKCGIYFQSCTDNTLAMRINQLDIAATGKPFWQHIANLIGTKNDFKHDRGPTSTDEYIDRIPENQTWLIECIKSMMFLTEYPIRQVCDTEESRQGQIFLTCLRLDGDHPGFKKERVQYRKHLPKRDLFIETSPDSWISLYPYVQLLACKTCGMHECYFIDKLDYSRKVAVLKSFERGHTANSSDVGELLCELIDSQQTNQPVGNPQP